MKMSRVTIFTALAAGLIFGSAVTYICVKKKYELITQEEIDSVKKSFQHARDMAAVKDLSEADKLPDDTIIFKEVKDTYSNTIKNNGYTSTHKEKPVDEPHIISPDEFGEYDDYVTVSLTYYDDGVLADDIDELVEDVDEVVGMDFFSHFGEYEDDSVFVRNDRLRCDYEILLDHRRYSDVIKDNPRLRMEER
jgi:hypothetical protein